MVAIVLLSKAAGLKNDLENFDYNLINQQALAMQQLTEQQRVEMAESKRQLAKLQSEFRTQTGDIVSYTEALAQNTATIEKYNDHLARLVLLEPIKQNDAIDVATVPTAWIPYKFEMTFCGNVYNGYCHLYKVEYEFQVKVLQMNAGQYSSVREVLESIFAPNLVYFHRDELNWAVDKMDEHRAFKALKFLEFYAKDGTKIEIRNDHFKYVHQGTIEKHKTRDLPLRANR